MKLRRPRSKRLLRLSTAQVELVAGTERTRIKRDDNLKHHIPSSLIELILDLRMVRLREILGEFAGQYKEKPFKSSEEPEEYRMISDLVSKMLDSLDFPNEVVSKVDRVMKVQLAFSEAERQYREHFVHPFQVFLVGMTVIDRHYALFERWFSPELCKDPRTSMEGAWLLASVFHDHLKPVGPLIQLTRGLLGKTDDEQPSISDEITNTKELLDWLDATYGALLGSGTLPNQIPTITTNTELRPILEEYTSKDNHGVLAGLNVLHWIRDSGQAVKPSDVAAALAMVLHDGDYQHKRALPQALFRAKVFPLPFNQQPLSCLLIWCDTVQEWGRWTHKQNVDTRLVKITFEDSGINFRLSFDDPEAIKPKIEEVGEIGNSILESDLEFTFDFRIHPADIGLRRRGNPTK